MFVCVHGTKETEADKRRGELSPFPISKLFTKTVRSTQSHPRNNPNFFLTSQNPDPTESDSHSWHINKLTPIDGPPFPATKAVDWAPPINAGSWPVDTRLYYPSPLPLITTPWLLAPQLPLHSTLTAQRFVFYELLLLLGWGPTRLSRQRRRRSRRRWWRWKGGGSWRATSWRARGGGRRRRSSEGTMSWGPPRWISGGSPSRIFLRLAAGLLHSSSLVIYLLYFWMIMIYCCIFFLGFDF